MSAVYIKNNSYSLGVYGLIEHTFVSAALRRVWVMEYLKSHVEPFDTRVNLLAVK